MPRLVVSQFSALLAPVRSGTPEALPAAYLSPTDPCTGFVGVYYPSKGEGKRVSAQYSTSTEKRERGNWLHSTRHSAAELFNTARIEQFNR